jgi:hypothetical protein
VWRSQVMSESPETDGAQLDLGLPFGFRELREAFGDERPRHGRSNLSISGLRASSAPSGRGTALVPTARSMGAASRPTAGELDGGEGHGGIYAPGPPAGGRAVAGSNPVSPTGEVPAKAVHRSRRRGHAGRGAQTGNKFRVRRSARGTGARGVGGANAARPETQNRESSAESLRVASTSVPALSTG